MVLDASALLAFLNHEPGAQVVGESLPGAAISAVNLSEVIAKLVDQGTTETALRATLDSLGLTVYSFDTTLAYAAGLLRPSTRAFGLSLGDRACLALAEKLGLPAITADRAWLELPDFAELVRAIR